MGFKPRTTPFKSRFLASSALSRKRWGFQHVLGRYGFLLSLSGSEGSMELPSWPTQDGAHFLGWEGRGRCRDNF